MRDAGRIEEQEEEEEKKTVEKKEQKRRRKRPKGSETGLTRVNPTGVDILEYS